MFATLKNKLKLFFQWCWDPERRHKTITIVYSLIWLLLWLDWTAWHRLNAFFYWVGFTPSFALAIYWLERFKHADLIRFRLLATAFLFPVWHWYIFATYEMAWISLSVLIARVGLAVIFFIGLAWTVWYVEKQSMFYQAQRLASGASSFKGRRQLQKVTPLEAIDHSRTPIPAGDWIWNPVDLDAFYYGGKKPKLNQSMTTLTMYALLFFLCFLLLTTLAGCREIYEMPAGGGEQKPIQQVVKVQKIIKKKFIINPLSAVLFNPPPIEDVPLQLMEITKHTYTVGYGQGKGAGFAGGTNRGKVRFIRLEYAGGDWDQDFGIGADLNMLIEYGVRTSHKVADKTESRKVAQLKNFPIGKSPPVVYMTGQRNISLSSSEVKILRSYLTDQHGMIFGDDGGSRHWHGQFFNMMRMVLPNFQPVKVPLDHPIHRVPFSIPFLPYVAPHGGNEAWGWVIDGRLAVYYHPGDIGDAWSDGHAGVKTEIWELCYQLGVNVLFYGHAEYNKWLDARNKED